MPDHERPAGTTSSTTTAAAPPQATGTPFFGPRRPNLTLDPAQVQAIFQRSEAPVRRWLDNNSSRVTQYNEGDLILLIRRSVSEAAEMGEGNIRGIIRSWASEHGVRVPPMSLVPLAPTAVPPPSSSPSGIQMPRLDFSLGSFQANIQLPTEAVARLPLSLGGRHRLSFRLSAEVPGDFSFSAAYDGIPHVRIGLRAGASVSGSASLRLFVESADRVCQARNAMQLRESLQTAGVALKNAIEAVQSSPTPRADESDIDFAMRWAQVGIKIAGLHDAVESARRNQCTDQPRWSVEMGYNPEGFPNPRIGDAPRPELDDMIGITGTWRF
ncbi:MAG: hypothetical protein IPM98_12280 [Lewinellaceae bacterium]|nr:hypothetical protein [Lewinellaceae bacterium]